MTDTRRYAVWPDTRSRSRLLESHSRGVDRQSRPGLIFTVGIKLNQLKVIPLDSSLRTGPVRSYAALQYFVLARVQSYSSGGVNVHKFSGYRFRFRQVAPMCSHGRAHWRHLANTIEPSVCGSDAALCQIDHLFCYLFCDVLKSRPVSVLTAWLSWY